MKETENRQKTIVRTSLVGIGVNVLLAAFKAVIGLMSHSIAVVLDAVNNLSDALSSVITIIGARLAGKAPDKKHPLGHGRIEYLSAAIVAVIVLYAGITSLVESVKKIISPEDPEYGAVSLIIIAAAVGAKLVLGRYVKSVGEKINSDALTASGEDARFDAVISASTLAAAVIYLVSGLQLEAWLGAAISIVIIKSGIEMISGTISDIIGCRVDSDLSKDIRSAIAEIPEVGGAYDLLLHSYGPELLVGSVHIDVPETMDAHRIDEISRQIQQTIYRRFGVIMEAIGIYSSNSGDPEISAMQQDIRSIAGSHPEVLQLHGLFIDREDRRITMDAVVSFDAEDRPAVTRSIREEVSAHYPDYHVAVTLDSDFSDIA